LEKQLNIIALNVPYPVDYGGVYDLFYKLPALQQQGVLIHLHCFSYGRAPQPELEKYCASVQYYERDQSIKQLGNALPYIVISRSSEKLLQQLLQNDFPIVMEGIHCSFLLTDERFSNRKCFVRLHNIESDYYRHLYRHTRSLFKKLYFWRESDKLYRYQERIGKKAVFWTVNKNDAASFRSRFGANDIYYLPIFLPPWEVDSLKGFGTYCLYHGDLSVSSNEKMAIWLLKNIFNKVEIPFVIAGKSPSKKLQRLTNKNPNNCLIADPSENEMQDLITKAHINLVPSYHSTGIKLKLLNALYHGRHCVTNHATVKGSGLDEACHIVEKKEAIRQLVEQLNHQPFTDADIQLRKHLLENEFNNTETAKKIVLKIWGE
jgi:hypothetical protein